MSSFLGNFSLFFGFDTEFFKNFSICFSGTNKQLLLGKQRFVQGQEMKFWTSFPNKTCHLNKSSVASGLPLAVPPGTGPLVGDRPRAVSGVSWPLRAQHPVLPWETLAWKQVILLSPGQCRASHLFTLAICLFFPACFPTPSWRLFNRNLGLIVLSRGSLHSMK